MPGHDAAICFCHRRCCPSLGPGINLMSVLQMLWDRVEPAGFLGCLASQPHKQALFQYGLGDSQVSWLGTYAQARSIGNAATFVLQLG